jgi:hypothetical protein
MESGCLFYYFFVLVCQNNFTTIPMWCELIQMSPRLNLYRSKFRLNQTSNVPLFSGTIQHSITGDSLPTVPIMVNFILKSLHENSRGNTESFT